MRATARASSPTSARSTRTYVPPEHVTRKSMSGARNEVSSNASTRIGRGAASRASPLRAASYSLRPPTFTAEYAGGVCRDSPMSAVIAERTSSSVDVTGRSAVTSPSASSVVVSTPRRADPSYVFGRSPRNRSNRVARPTPRTSSPVAIGSSVPACPTFRVPSVRRTTSTTSCDVIPPGLSTSSSPSGSVTSRRRAGRRHGRGRSQRGDQPRDRAGGAVLRGVARRQPVPAAAEGGGDRGQVVLAPRARADLEPSVRPLLEHGRDVHVADRADEVDQVVGLLRADAGVGEVRLRQVRPDEVDLRIDRGARRAPPPRPAGTRDGCPRTGPAPCARDRTGARGARRRRGASRAWSPRTGSGRCPSRARRTGRPRSRRASSPPISSISRNTISHVEEAAGSINGIVPRPSFERWWSIQITSVAFDAAEPSGPSRSNDAQSHVTITAGASG